MQSDAWERLAQEDPLWAICFRKDARGGKWDLEEFLASGRTEIEWAWGVLAEADAIPARRRLAVDFGCGVGRLTQALTGKVDEVIGIDASATMLELATELAVDLPCTFARDLSGVADGSVDVIYSSLVLQHVPVEDLPRYLAEFQRVLAKDGCGLLHYPIAPRSTPSGIGYRVLPAAAIARLQRHVLRYPAPMAMSWLSVPEMTRRIEAAGLRSGPVTDGLQHSRHWKDGWYLIRPPLARR
jgi:ubiquinone/menaquinone biosynthesis C-methylase UbiE